MNNIDNSKKFYLYLWLLIEPNKTKNDSSFLYYTVDIVKFWYYTFTWSFNYKELISKRDLNKRTNLGRKNLVNKYIITTKKKKLNTTWLTKKNGTNCGILNYIITIFYPFNIFSLTGSC
jgi:hypothetical protein